MILHLYYHSPFTVCCSGTWLPHTPTSYDVSYLAGLACLRMLSDQSSCHTNKHISHHKNGDLLLAFLLFFPVVTSQVVIGFSCCKIRLCQSEEKNNETQDNKKTFLDGKVN